MAQVTLPPQLVVVEGAKDVRSRQRPDGGVELQYQVDYPFPAAELIERFRTALPIEDWQPLMEDWLDSGTPTSHQRGWGSHINGIKKPNTLVHVWSAPWKDRNGNLVFYGLQYESKYDGSFLEQPDNSHLEVIAVWFPAAAVEAIVRAVRSVR
jgi:hypothetical protein